MNTYPTIPDFPKEASELSVEPGKPRFFLITVSGPVIGYPYLKLVRAVTRKAAIDQILLEAITWTCKVPWNLPEMPRAELISALGLSITAREIPAKILTGMLK